MKKGIGSKIYDVDGNEYVDYYLGAGALILGHCNHAIIESVSAQLKLGSLLVPANELELDVARLISRWVPSVEMVRFTSSGTEAVEYAVKLARRYTSRPIIVRFNGEYHGGLSLSADYPGVGVKFLPFNDEAKFEQLVAQVSDKCAGVITEPFPRGWSGPKRGFLELLRKRCSEIGALLIFDEVVTGFRFGRGGAQEFYGVKPDLSVFGKALGGGFPIGAFGGSRKIMDLINPSQGERRSMFHGGTFSGNCISMSAAKATLSELGKRSSFAYLTRTGEQIRKILKDAAQSNELDVCVTGQTSLWNVFFASGDVYNYETELMLSNKEALQVFHRELIRRGILTEFASRSFTSLAHRKEDVDKLSESIYASMKVVKRSLQGL